VRAATFSRREHARRRAPDPAAGAQETTMAAKGETTVPSVLLVDDRPENLLALEGILKPLGARLVKARSGEEALLHLLRETFAVILLDVQMPRLDGLQTAELIKQREQTRHVPIIFITALSREAAYVFKGYAHGAVDYLLKPIDPEIVRAKVRVFCDLWVRGEKMRRQAAQSEMKDVFLASVAHEMRTPLAAAKAQAQLALHQMVESDCDKMSASALRLISRQIDKVVDLVSDLLDASRLEAGVLQINKTEVDLAVLAKDVVARLKVLADGHDIAVDVPERAVVLADRDRLEQVLTNLLSNAMRYSPEGGRIDVAVQAHPEWMQLSVRDRGLGVPKEQQLRIFDRFARVHAGDGGAGVGLGLSIAKAIVDQHGGRVWVESSGKPGEGSTFLVRIPVRKSP
jgi:signal transduction histidine kinase